MVVCVEILPNSLKKRLPVYIEYCFCRLFIFCAFDHVAKNRLRLPADPILDDNAKLFATFRMEIGNFS